MTAIACSYCFSNFGFRRTLENWGPSTGERCARCGVEGGVFLTKQKIIAAATRFFVEGSVAAETLAPVFHVIDSVNAAAGLDPTISDDVKLLKELARLVVIDNAPPLWRLGRTNHFYQFQDGDPAVAADALVESAEIFEIKAEADLYRVRLNIPADPTLFDPSTFDPPPPEVVRASGRWDTVGTPVLYVSDDVELCVHECRATLSDEIVLAVLRPTRTLRLLNVAGGFGPPPTNRFEDGQLFADFMSRSRADCWQNICRAVGKAAHRAGYDGVRYTSYYSFSMNSNKGVNLALFGRPLSEGLLRLHSVNRVRMKSVQYEIEFGPVFYDAARSLP